MLRVPSLWQKSKVAKAHLCNSTHSLGSPAGGPWLVPERSLTLRQLPQPMLLSEQMLLLQSFDIIQGDNICLLLLLPLNICLCAYIQSDLVLQLQMYLSVQGSVQERRPAASILSAVAHEGKAILLAAGHSQDSFRGCRHRPA